MRVLVIEDDAGIGKLVRQGLEEANFQVDWALDGATGLRLAVETVYNVVILDLMLPCFRSWMAGVCAKSCGRNAAGLLC